MWKVIAGAVAALLVLAALIVGLYMGGGADQSFLERSRDIVIVIFGFWLVLSTILLTVAVGALAFLIIMVRQKLIPIMERMVDMQESTLETLNRVKGTADFVSEEVAAPIISVYGTVAKGKMLMRTVAGRNKQDVDKVANKLLNES